MEEQRTHNRPRPFRVSRDAGLIVGVSVALSMIALALFSATLP